MSRIGKKPLAIPSGVEVSVSGSNLTVKGPKATLARPVHDQVEIKVADGEVVVTPKDSLGCRPKEDLEDDALLGNLSAQDVLCLEKALKKSIPLIFICPFT